MNWEDLGKTLLGLGLPTLGTVLAGPLGGAAGKAIADQLGVPATPAAVNAAITADPAVAQKLAETDAEWARTMATIAQAGAQQGSEVNQTARAEIAAGVSWWHWRHLLGYVVGGWIAGIAVAFTRLMWVAEAGQIANVTQLLNSGFAYFGAACGLLGYVAMDTSRRTTAAAAGSEIPTVLGTIIKAVKR